MKGEAFCGPAGEPQRIMKGEAFCGPAGEPRIYISTVSQMTQ